jgi:hypothetical protein
VVGTDGWIEVGGIGVCSGSVLLQAAASAIATTTRTVNSFSLLMPESILTSPKAFGTRIASITSS